MFLGADNMKNNKLTQLQDAFDRVDYVLHQISNLSAKEFAQTILDNYLGKEINTADLSEIRDNLEQHIYKLLKDMDNE